MLKRLRNYSLYTYTGTYLRPRIAIMLVIFSLLIGVSGFMLIEGYALIEAVYMTVITISTVGYTEVQPLSSTGKIFSSGYILMNIGIFSYSLSAFTYFVIQGQIFKKLHMDFLEKRIDDLRDHVILCGYGRYGKEIVDHFLAHNIPFVVIERDAEEIELIQKSEKRILYIHDDATHDDVLVQAGIERAKALVSALADDTENLFTVLTARQLSPTINIISRTTQTKSQRKMLLAGANHIVMPEQIGGFYMATLVSKPGAIEFFTFITNHFGSDIEFEEFTYTELPDICRGKTIRELHIRKATGANIISFKLPDGSFIVNPSPDVRLVVDSSFIVLGTRKQLDDLRSFMDDLTESDLEQDQSGNQ